MSHLESIGAPSEGLMNIATWTSTILSLMFFTGLFAELRRLKINAVPLIDVLGASLMFGWAAAFHSGNPLHGKGARSSYRFCLAHCVL